MAIVIPAYAAYLAASAAVAAVGSGYYYWSSGSSKVEVVTEKELLKRELEDLYVNKEISPKDVLRRLREVRKFSEIIQMEPILSDEKKHAHELKQAISSKAVLSDSCEVRQFTKIVKIEPILSEEQKLERALKQKMEYELKQQLDFELKQALVQKFANAKTPQPEEEASE